MSFRATWFWVITAGVLFAIIYLHERYAAKPQTGPLLILPNLKPAAVTNVQVRPGAELVIKADRTNGGWRLTEPVVYPAESPDIENLLLLLSRLTPAASITPDELNARPNADQEYGFDTPQASIILQQPDYRVHLLVGAKTAPGDQLFLQVVGVGSVFVVSTDLLKWIPRTASDWRESALIHLEELAFDHIAVTNVPKSFELVRDPANRLWRLSAPTPARADNVKIEFALQRLGAARIQQFISDDPKADLESRGLLPPDLEIALSESNRTVAVVHFGKSPTNDPQQVFARRQGESTIFTVPKDVLTPWRVTSANDMRDLHLLTLTAPIQEVDVHGDEAFSIQRQTNGSWRVLPQDVPADSNAVQELLFTLSTMQIIQFVKDVVTAPDLPTYGLASPARQFTIRSAPAEPGAAPTNALLAVMNFGTNQDDKVFVQRTDESSVYAVSVEDFRKLPAAGWQLRARQIWHFSQNDITGATLNQQGRVRQMVRKAEYSWSLAPGSQGIINDLAIEETVRGLIEVKADAWVAQGDENRARYGFNADSLQIEVNLKSGAKASIEFGGEAPSGFPYAAVTLDGRLWIFEFPVALYRDVMTYLSVPVNP